MIVLGGIVLFIILAVILPYLDHHSLSALTRLGLRPTELHRNGILQGPDGQ